jgi:hypothetical protein
MHEYELLEKEHGFTVEMFQQINRDAYAASFCRDKERVKHFFEQ